MKRHVRVGLVALALLTAGGAAQAGQLGLLAETGLISGRQSFVFAMDVAVAGTLQVQLSDLNWQGRLSDLSFSIVDSTGNLVQADPVRPQALAASVSDAAKVPAQKIYTLSVPGTYSVYVSGSAAGSRYGLGVYSLSAMLEADAIPVPLPAAGLLLVSGIGALGAAMRGRRAGSSGRRDRSDSLKSLAQ